MLRLSHLAIGHQGCALHRDLCATLPSGTLTALVGRNGTGKSTLLRTIASLLPPVAGHVYVGEEQLDGLSPKQVAHRIALVLTARINAPALRASELIALGRLPHLSLMGAMRAIDHQAIARAIELTEVGALLDREVRTLSDGERQRVMIARALAQQTPLLLLDEPTAFLDHPTKHSTLALLHRIAHDEGLTVLLSSHDLALTLPQADHLWLLTADGLLTGTPTTLTAAMEREFALNATTCAP